jgi:hypothetical protein
MNKTLTALLLVTIAACGGETEPDFGIVFKPTDDLRVNEPVRVHFTTEDPEGYEVVVAFAGWGDREAKTVVQYNDPDLEGETWWNPRFVGTATHNRASFMLVNGWDSEADTLPITVTVTAWDAEGNTQQVSRTYCQWGWRIHGGCLPPGVDVR